MGENTSKLHAAMKEPWQPGQSGNPAGRPKGARNKLSETFLQDVIEDWQEGGKEALVRCRNEKPDVYVRAIASLIPKEFVLSNESDLTDEQVREQLRQLESALRPFLGIEGTVGADEGTAAQAKPH